MSEKLSIYVTNGKFIVHLIFVLLTIVYITIEWHFIQKSFNVDNDRLWKVKSNKNIKRHRFSTDGNILKFINLEISLIIRNKRPSQIMIMLVVLLFYFLISLKRQDTLSPLFSLIITVMTIGLGPTIYGQFMFSWESSYFDFLMTKPIQFKNFLKARYYLLVLLTLILNIPTFVILSRSVRLDLLFSQLLFTLGVTNFIVMFFATFNKNKIDLKKSKFMNYEGLKLSHITLQLIFIFLPVAILSVAKDCLSNLTIGITILGLVGVIFILFHSIWLERVIATSFFRHKYINIEGYRKNFE